MNTVVYCLIYSSLLPFPLHVRLKTIVSNLLFTLKAEVSLQDTSVFLNHPWLSSMTARCFVGAREWAHFFEGWWELAQTLLTQLEQTGQVSIGYCNRLVFDWRIIWVHMLPVFRNKLWFCILCHRCWYLLSYTKVSRREPSELKNEQHSRQFLEKKLSQ